MAGDRPPRGSHPLSSLLACVLTVGLLAGVAAANPKAFDRMVDRARTAILGDDESAGRDGDATGGSSPSVTSECDAVLEAYRLAAPPSDDAGELAHAIDVVHDNCAKDPQARGLVRALERLLANAERQGPSAHGAGVAAGPGGGQARGDRAGGSSARNDGHGPDAGQPGGGNAGDHAGGS